MVTDTSWARDGFEKLCDVVLVDGLPVIDYAGRSHDSCLTYLFLANGEPVHVGQCHKRYGLVTSLCGLTSPIARGSNARIRDGLIDHLRSGDSVELLVRVGHSREILGEKRCDCPEYEDAILRKYPQAGAPAELHPLAA